MRKLLLFSFLFVIFTIKSIAQENYLELVKNHTGRMLKIKEGKRVVVKTTDKKRFVGKINFIDSLHLEVEGNVVRLDSISFIKKRATVGIISRSVSMYVGSNLLAAGIIAIPTGIGAIVSVVVLPPSIPLLIYAINSNKRRSESWKYKIVFK